MDRASISIADINSWSLSMLKYIVIEADIIIKIEVKKIEIPVKTLQKKSLSIPVNLALKKLNP